MSPDSHGQLDFIELSKKSKAEVFDEENPIVWKEFEKTCFKIISRGLKHYGAKAIFEIIRYHRSIETNDPKFKLNNNYTAYYARKFIKKHQEHENFFEIRKSKGN